MKRRWVFGVLFVLIIVFGFVRDHVFVTINASIKEAQSSTLLFAFKWVLTILFFTVYGIMTHAFLVVLFKSQQYFRLVLLVYFSLFIISAIFGVVGYILGSFTLVYPVIRAIMGFAQSPLPLMLLLLACLLHRQISAQKG